MTEYVSSDTNVWIDFHAIGAVELPFRLPCTFVMWAEALEEEVISPATLRSRLVAAGLHPVKITIEEFLLADSYGSSFVALSVFDRVALAIAKSRGIPLMTGDRHLRNAASKENVEFVGTIGVLDRLLAEGKATAGEYRTCIERLIEKNGGIIRLPANELEARLNRSREEVLSEMVRRTTEKAPASWEGRTFEELRNEAMGLRHPEYLPADEGGALDPDSL